MTPGGGSSSSRRRGRSTTTSSPPTSQAGLPRIVEFHRNRDLYMRKHHSAAAARGREGAHRLVLRACGRSRRWPARAARRGVYWAHARQALIPGRGSGIRDRVEGA